MPEPLADPLRVTGAAADEVRALVPDIEMLAIRLGDVGYLVDESLATSMFLGVRLPQPLLLEGEAGVGKTTAAKALAAVLDTPFIRLQCYEGIDSAEALYEWNYPRQLLSIRMADTSGGTITEDDLFGPDYLIRRPLLRALEHPGPRPAVLLIDEIDRADDDFEAFLLELLAEASVTIPEIGTITATHPPIIVLTSNRTRDLHDAVKRRCLYHWIGYPSLQRAVDIVRRRVPGASQSLAVQVATAVARMRESDVQKPPGIAEAIDWLSALDLLGVATLDSAVIDRTLGSVLKYEEDQDVGARRRPRGAPSTCRLTPASPSRPSSSTCRRSPARSASGCMPPACRSRPPEAPSLPVRSRWSAPRAAAGSTGRRARCTSPTRTRARRSTPCSPRCSAGWSRMASSPTSSTPRPSAPTSTRRRPGRPPPSTRWATAHGRRGSPARTTMTTRHETDVPLAIASDEERLASKRFDGLDRYELARLYRLMTRTPAGDPHAACAPLPARPPRPAHRHAPHASHKPSHRRRPDPAGTPAAARRATAAGDAVRHLGLDGAVRPRLPPVPHLRGRRRARTPRRSCLPRGSPGSRVRSPHGTPSGRSSGLPPRRPTGRAARASATRSGTSTTTTAGAAWRAARSS